MNPEVSVVIPTRNRPALVREAVESALSQSRVRVEVVAVVDGPDDATLRSLDAITDERLVVEALGSPLGQCGATNAGVARACAPWVGLLDDDDIWFPDKLERQLAAAKDASSASPVVGGRVVARSEKGDEVWPRRVPLPGEPVSEYLLCRDSLLWGERLLQSSVILAPRTLMQRIPFREHLVRHSDLDWLIRAGSEPDVSFLFPPGPAPVAVWRLASGRPRASHSPDWRMSLAWVGSLGDAVTPRAHAGFVLTWLAANAVEQGERSAAVTLLREAWRRGRPGARELLIFTGIMGLPWRLRESLSRSARMGVTRAHGWTG